MRRTAFALLFVAAACGSSRSNGAPQVIASSSTTAEQARAIDGPVMRYPDASSTSGTLATQLRGVLQLEGGCLYLARDAIGERFPILWPAGTRWDGQNQSVVSPVGDVMPIGGPVEGRGGMFFLTDLDRLAGSAAWNLAVRCVDSTGEIAVMQNSGTAIGPKGN